MRPDKDSYFLEHALVASRMSTCVRRSVGCVLVNARRQIMGVGFNGVPSSLPHCAEGHPCPGASSPSGTALDKCFATHAEANALLQCRDPYAIETVYTTTSPCTDCTKLLLNTSARRVVFLEEYPQDDPKRLWTSAGREWVRHECYLPPDDRSIRRMIRWLDDMASVVSNLSKPRRDNHYGRAAEALERMMDIRDPRQPKVLE